MTADETTAQTAVVDVESAVLDALHAAHHQAGSITMLDLARHVAAALAPLIAAAEQRGRDEQAAVRAVLDTYFDFDVDPWDDHDVACPDPEDVWRLHRDLRAVLSPNTDAALAKVRADAWVGTEWTAWREDAAQQVGVGTTENQSTAQEDVAAWRGDGYPVRLMARRVGPWQPADTEGGDDA